MSRDHVLNEGRASKWETGSCIKSTPCKEHCAVGMQKCHGKKIVRKACNYIPRRNAQANAALVFSALGGVDLAAFGFGCGWVSGRGVARAYAGRARNPPPGAGEDAVNRV